MNKTQQDIDNMNLITRINALAAQGAYTTGKPALVDPDLKSDLDSFRTARNLVDHAVKTKRRAMARERQFPERMLMGARLTSVLLGLQRTVR